MLTHGFLLFLLPAFRDGVHPYRHPPSGQLCIDDIHRQEPTGSWPVVLKIARVTEAASLGTLYEPIFVRTSFLTKQSDISDGESGHSLVTRNMIEIQA